MQSGDRALVIRAGVLTAIVDGLFSSLLSAFAYELVGHFPFVGLPIVGTACAHLDRRTASTIAPPFSSHR